jgi:hypothetical protein
VTCSFGRRYGDSVKLGSLFTITGRPGMYVLCQSHANAAFHQGEQLFRIPPPPQQPWPHTAAPLVAPPAGSPYRPSLGYRLLEAALRIEAAMMKEKWLTCLLIVANIFTVILIVKFASSGGVGGSPRPDCSPDPGPDIYYDC